ncbi:response regulator [Croceibacterium sp. LX-88]|uniref:histidine kinase n=1 Tax=Croceibacterium selenioxidans TaxID=2838833 RepID=A0ABS5VZC9_9SPHN|nr:response regulator [Croceibacterium selenioxidans]MBT2132881.1 response regulator [Croceibacterium selenioxidans]
MPRARILLVDDDERNLLALSEVLEPIADVITATSGRLALRELLKGDFAVILLDVFMPEMDGYETASLIRKRAQTARIPIIFLSAVNKETEHLMRGYAMGAVDYVFKPVDPIVLKSKVAVFVDLFQLRQQVATRALAEQELREATLRAEAERLVYERELQQTRLQQALILEALPLAVYEASVDEDGRPLRRFVGGDIAKFAGADADSLLSGELRWEDRIVNGDPAEPETGTSVSQYRWSRSDGSVIHVIDQRVRPGGDDGVWVGTLIDVSAQRELEQQLVQLRKTEALGQLTGGVAHDFNNLLAAVLGGLRLIEGRVELGIREQRIFEHMRHAAENGVELVRRLMAFARKQELSPVAIEPAKLCDIVSGLVDHAIGETLSVEWEVNPNGLRIFADEGQLELALVNLLINARDAMTNGGKISVEIEEVARPDGLRARDGAPHWLRISVCDQGVGIPAELIERVTEPFFTTKGPGKGTGLGLSMVAGFVEQSGGLFRIVSETGTGTQVQMTFPATKSDARNAAAATTGDERTNLVGSVLVVDDDDGVRMVVSEQLRDLGLNVSEAENAERALALLQNEGAAEFLLTDFSMPGMDGLSLIMAVRGRWPQMRGAIMTGNPKGKLASCDPQIPVIHKPIDMGELKRLLTAA